MFIERLSNEFYPIGRDRKRMKADFIGEDPSWLVMPLGVTRVNNGFQTSGVHKIESVPIVAANIAMIGFGVGNWRLHSESSTPSMKLVNTDGTREIGLYTESEITYFRYIVNGTTVYEDDEVMVGSNGIRKSMFVASQSTPYGVRPKNIAIYLLPETGYFHVVRNGSVIYSRSNLKTINTTGVDWSGTWKFVVESNGQMNGSSIEMMMEQDI